MEGVGRRGFKRGPFGGPTDSGSRTEGVCTLPLGGGGSAAEQCGQVGDGYPNPKRHLLYDGREQVNFYQL
jgi:hypothetical protein